jgi:hypothetical protein
MNTIYFRSKAAICVAALTLSLLTPDPAFGQKKGGTGFTSFRWQSEASMNEMKGSEFARVKLSTRIELGIDSDGINPLVEPVTVDFEP